MEACLWSELVRNSERFEYMLFPRLLAVAERAWHTADWEMATNVKEYNTRLEKDWRDFANTLGYKELRRLEQLGVRYRLPPPGVKYDGCQRLLLTASSIFHYLIKSNRTLLDFLKYYTLVFCFTTWSCNCSQLIIKKCTILGNFCYADFICSCYPYLSLCMWMCVCVYVGVYYIWALNVFRRMAKSLTIQTCAVE